MSRLAGDLATATIVVTDVVGSTTTRTRLGEAEADAVFARHGRLLRGVARAHRAMFVKSVGDGIMAVFDSATEALMAAAGIQQAVGVENRRATTGLEVRIGVSSGDIIWTDDDVDGLPAVQAARLAQVAEGGQLLCSELAARLTFGREGLDFKDVGRLDLKGLEEPLRTFEVLWWQRPPNQPALPPWLCANDLLPFVGREAELATLHEWLRHRPHGPAIAVASGEAGVGKTRFVGEVVAAALDRGHVLLAGRCTDPAIGPVQPLAEAVEGLAMGAPSLVLDAAERVDLSDLARLTPVLTRAPFGLRPKEIAGAETEFFGLVGALARLIEQLGATSPAILFIDDLQWATESTVTLLRGVLLELGDHPLHVVVSVRSSGGDVGRSLSEGGRDLLTRAAVTYVEVPTLTAGDIATALDSSPSPASAETIATVDVEQIARMTGGNAFLVTETIRELQAGREVGRAAPSQAVALFITARVERVSRSARQLIQLVAGTERIEPAVLRRALGTGEEEFVDAAEEAIATGLVVTQGDGSLTMAHALARAAVTASVSALRAGLVQRRLVDALTAVHPDIARTRPYLLAEHLVAVAELGGPDDVARARDAAETAGRHATTRLAHQEAAAWFERSLALHDRLHDDSPTTRVALVLALGEAMWRSGDPGARPMLIDAGRQAEALGRHDLLIQAALAGNRGFFSATAGSDEGSIALLSIALAVVDPADLTTRAELLASLAAELTWSPDADRRFALADEAVELARESADLRTLVRVLAERALTISAADTLDQRLADSEEFITLAELTGDDFLRFQAAFQRTGPLLELGQLSDVAGLLERAGQLARSLAQPELQWLIEFSSAGLALMRGNVAVAAERSERALELGRSAGRGWEALAFYSAQLTEVRRLQGRLEELTDGLQAVLGRARVDPVHSVLRYLCEAGATNLDEALAVAIRTGFPPPRNLAQRGALDNLTFVAARLGRRDLLPVLYDELLPWADTFGMGAVAYPCGHHFLAVAAAALDERALAERHFEAALATHARAQAPLLLAESAIEWMALLRASGEVIPPDLARRTEEALAGREAPLLVQRRAEVLG